MYGCIIRTQVQISKSELAQQLRALVAIVEILGSSLSTYTVNRKYLKLLPQEIQCPLLTSEVTYLLHTQHIGKMYA